MLSKKFQKKIHNLLEYKCVRLEEENVNLKRFLDISQIDV
jgi:hypothetical protein